MKNILAFPGAKTAARTSIDHERVMRLKTLIAEGKFEINAERVADRLIDSLKQTLPTDKRKA